MSGGPGEEGVVLLAQSGGPSRFDPDALARRIAQTLAEKGSNSKLGWRSRPFFTTVLPGLIVLAVTAAAILIVVFGINWLIGLSDGLEAEALSATVSIETHDRGNRDADAVSDTHGGLAIDQIAAKSVGGSKSTSTSTPPSSSPGSPVTSPKSTTTTAGTGSTSQPGSTSTSLPGTSSSTSTTHHVSTSSSTSTSTTTTSTTTTSTTTTSTTTTTTAPTTTTTITTTTTTQPTTTTTAPTTTTTLGLPDDD